MRLRLRNKGSRAHKRGRQRPKHEAPWPEHPQTGVRVEHKDTPQAMPGIWKPSTARYGDTWPAVADAPAHMPERPTLQFRLDVY